MSDLRYRALELRAASSPADEASWLAERVRTGGLRGETLGRAASLGHGAACLALGVDPPPLAAWIAAVDAEAHGPLEASIAAARVALPAWEELHDDGRPRAALEAAARYAHTLRDSAEAGVLEALDAARDARDEADRERYLSSGEEPDEEDDDLQAALDAVTAVIRACELVEEDVAAAEYVQLTGRHDSPVARAHSSAQPAIVAALLAIGRSSSFEGGDDEAEELVRTAVADALLRDALARV